MSNILYVGFRIEISTKYINNKNYSQKYNSSHEESKIIDTCNDGKVIVCKKNDMLLSKGKRKDKNGVCSGLTNFSVMIPIKQKKEIERIVKIINVLGNDRLIRERVYTFVYNNSVLNAIPELLYMKTALNDIEKYISNFVNVAWYYAPDAILE